MNIGWTIHITDELIDTWLGDAKCPVGNSDWILAKEVPFQRERAISEMIIAAEKFGLKFIDCTVRK